MKFTVLTDNNGRNGLEGEWGLSVFIEYNGKNFLLDAGNTGLFAENAKKLGIDLETVEAAFLSHAHYDHSDGFPEFFKANTKAKLYIRSGCRESCYARKEGKIEYIGIKKGFLSEFENRIERVDGIKEVCEGVWLVGHTTPGTEAVGKREEMFVRTASAYRPDGFDHEQSLVFKTGQGLVVFNSCSHIGAAAIIKEVSDAFEGEKVVALIGGFHLYNKSEKEVRAFAEAVKETGSETLVTGHCTGEEAFSILREELGDAVTGLYAGLEMSFPR